MIDQFKKWITRDVETAINKVDADLTAKITALEEKFAALVRDDEQIAALGRVVRATEYLAAAERHTRHQSGHRTEF